METDILLAGLNEAQREAVSQGDGPVLVLAGAGSGKTRVIAHRIAYLIRERHVHPRHIVALTFTNKAAREMRDRVTSLLGGTAHDVWLGTFHSFCAFILRLEIETIGFTRNFTIYDEADQRALVKDVMKDVVEDATRADANRTLHRISWLKQNLDGPDACDERDPFESVVKRVYVLYQDELRRRNSLDFDDLLRFAVRILTDNSAILTKYQRRFRYILVDEYQDTNHAQFKLIQLLACDHHNIFVVGDEDQSIYGWRGADLKNLLDFAKHFPETRLVRLEQNYRSTGMILDAASKLIRHNKRRLGKTLVSTRERGEKIKVYIGEDPRDEAQFVVREVRRSGRDYKDFAVLFRTNAQSRVVEESLSEAGIPYVVLAGVGFYERKEVKDILCYLRCLANPKDDVSFRRIVNVPPRGIGKVALETLSMRAATRGLSLFEMVLSLNGTEIQTERGTKKLFAFRDLLQDLLSKRDEFNVRDMLAHIIKITGYKTWIESSGDDRKDDRLANIDELLVAASEFVETTGGALHDFLQTTSLLTDVDRWDETKGAVALMTMHSAKGLEFPIVFVVGLEEGLMPHRSAFSSSDELEEERRLCYVAATRAKDGLYMTCARTRAISGMVQDQVESRFLNEIPRSLLEWRDAAELGYEDSDAEALTVGRKVKHDRWGTGVVLYKEGRGDTTRVNVLFDRDGRKREFVIKYCRLKLL